MEALPTTTRPYTDRFRDRADKFAFFAIFVIGSAAVIVMKALGADMAFVILVPCVLILTYAVVVFFSPRLRIRDDRAGDSLYYLGFLFTMVSLAHSLYEFRSADSTNPKSLVANFGVALATTILGMALRVMFHQMREDPDAMESEVRMEMAAAASQFRTELQQAVADFGVLRLAVGQTITETRDKSSQAASNMAQAVAATAAKAISEVSARATSNIEGQTAEFRSVLETVASEIKETAREAQGSFRRINRAADKTLEAVSKLAQRIDAVELPADTLRQKLESVGDGFAQTVQALGQKLKQDIEGLESLHAAMAGISEAANSLNRAASDAAGARARWTELERAAQDDIAAALSRLRSSVEEIASQVQNALNRQAEMSAEAWERELRRVRDSVSTWEEGVAAMTSGLRSLAEEYVSTGRKSADAARDELQAARDGIQHVLSSATAALTAFQAAVQQTHIALNQEAASQLDTVRGLRKVTEEEVAGMRTLREKLLADVNVSATAVEELQKALVSLSKLLLRSLSA